jgi:hypothetical protein
MDNISEEQLKSQVEWKSCPPIPVPGNYFIDMVPKIDTTAHDGSIDQDYKSINTPFLELFPVDILKEMKEFFAPVNETWLRKDAQIDANYYQEQSFRNELIQRDETKNTIEDVFDYQKYIRESFDQVEEDLSGYNVIEEYPIFPSIEEEYALMNGNINVNDSFEIVKGESSLVDLCKSNGKEYHCTKQHTDDNLCIEIVNGKAYYTILRYVYKLEAIKKPTQ